MVEIGFSVRRWASKNPHGGRGAPSPSGPQMSSVPSFQQCHFWEGRDIVVALHSYQNSSSMLRRVAHNGNENQTDKGLAILGRLDDGIDARDKVVSADDDNGGGHKDDDGGDEAHARLLMLALLPPARR